jgi:hypothetical protein
MNATIFPPIPLDIRSIIRDEVSKKRHDEKIAELSKIVSPGLTGNLMISDGVTLQIT